MGTALRAPALLLAATAAVLGAVASARAAEEPKLPEVNLTYRATWNGVGLGDVAVTLKPEGGTDCYRYESQSDPVGLVRMFYGKPHEVSNFCVSGGRVVPKKFQFFHDDDDSFTLEFDVAARKVRDDKGGEREIPPNAQDRFGMHQAVRLWVLSRLREKDPAAEKFEFSQVDDQKIRTYTMAITGRETLQIPAGKFETIVVERVDDPKKIAKFWVAPELDYMPVKVVTLRPRADLKMELKSRK
jgi:hypothetical protein